MLNDFIRITGRAAALGQIAGRLSGMYVSATGMRVVTLHVDLAASALGDDWRAVDVTLSQAPEYSDEQIRADAAAHYGVAIDQVGPVVASDEALDGERR